MIIRKAEIADAGQMVALLNAIIHLGGTTAHQRPYDAERMRQDYIAPKLGIATHVAVINDEIVGFQSLEWPDPSFSSMPPPGWTFVATFVAGSMAGKGVGRALFSATCDAGRQAGATVIDATIRADNQSGLGYYAAMGFRDYDRLIAVPLSDGAPVDRVRKRFDL